MIRIKKPTAPIVLKSRGPRATSELKAAVRLGMPLQFDKSVYAHEEVKDALRLAQAPQVRILQIEDYAYRLW